MKILKHTVFSVILFSYIIVPQQCGAATANPQATTPAKTLLARFLTLGQQSDQQMISGQLIGTLDGLAFNVADDMTSGYNAYVLSLKQSSGRTVALIGANFGRLKPCTVNNPLFTSGKSPYMNCDGSPPDFANDIDLLTEHWRSGGLVTVMWQAQNPWTGEGAHDTRIKGAFSDLMTEGSPIYSTWRKMLDDEATLLAKLRDRGVVVLFRPLHEQNGNWFWWGSHGANGHPTREEYVALWRNMFNYFTKEKHLDNLLWVFSVNRNDAPGQMLVFDPGEQFYDIIGLDYYEDTTSKAVAFQDLLRNDKPVAITEYGPTSGYETDASTKNQFDFLRVLDLKARLPNAIYFMAWNGPTAPQALIQNRNAAALLRQRSMITIENMLPR